MAAEQESVSRRARAVAAGVWAGALCAVIAAQPSLATVVQPSGGGTAKPPGERVLDPARFQRVDPAVDDVGSGMVSLRDLSVDLRMEPDFSLVYRIPGMGMPGAAEMFARRSGAVTAMFPRSVYVPTRDGLVPEVPPGTIFYIGDVPETAVRGWSRAAAPLSPVAAALRVDASAVSPEMRGPIASTRLNGQVAGAGGGRGTPVDWRAGPETQVAEEPLFVGVRVLLMQAVEGR